MIVRITLKNTEVRDVITDAIRKEFQETDASRMAGADAEEREELIEERIRVALQKSEQWFIWGEQLQVDFDTEKGTITPVSKVAPIVKKNDLR
jgi:hypothetical protein